MDASPRASRKRSTPPDALFIDTWGWLALADARDPGPQAVLERRARTAPGSLIPSDYVLDETFTRLFSRVAFVQARKFSDAIVAAGASEQLRIERITKERFDAAPRLGIRYRDKRGISFTDLTSFIVMRELGVKHVLTADSHFMQVQLGFLRVP
jgi:predicted nucleic acid-binding protein